MPVSFPAKGRGNKASFQGKANGNFAYSNMPRQIVNQNKGNKAGKMIRWLGKMSFLREIHAEITPPVELLPEIEEKAERSANMRATDKAGKGEMPHFYSMGKADLDSDLSLSNSLVCDTPREFVPVNEGELVANSIGFESRPSL